MILLSTALAYDRAAIERFGPDAVLNFSGDISARKPRSISTAWRRDKAEANRPRRIKPGTVLVREYQGDRHTVTVVPNGYVWHETTYASFSVIGEYQGEWHTVTVVAKGYVWREATYASLSIIARAITGTAWNGPRFFGQICPAASIAFSIVP
jgi:hypothetical protein